MGLREVSLGRRAVAIEDDGRCGANALEKRATRGFKKAG